MAQKKPTNREVRESGKRLDKIICRAFPRKFKGKFFSNANYDEPTLEDLAERKIR